VVSGQPIELLEADKASRLAGRQRLAERDHLLLAETQQAGPEPEADGRVELAAPLCLVRLMLELPGIDRPAAAPVARDHEPATSSSLSRPACNQHRHDDYCAPQEDPHRERPARYTAGQPVEWPADEGEAVADPLEEAVERPRHVAFVEAAFRQDPSGVSTR
jgi:hypothetical protein